jgi:hypothetical protein
VEADLRKLEGMPLEETTIGALYVRAIIPGV